VKFVHALVLTAVSVVTLQADPVSLKGQSRRDAVVTPLTDIAIPTVIAGGEFQTTITLVNLSPFSAEAMIYFANKDGGDLELPIVGVGSTNALRITIPARGSRSVLTEYRPDLPSREGWGFVINDGLGGTVGKVGGYSVIAIDGVETVTPFQTVAEKKTLMPFDNRGGLQSQLLVINFDARLTASITFTAYDEDGNVLVEQGSVDVPAIGRIFLDLNGLDLLKGRHGTIEIRTNRDFMATYGYRLNLEKRQWSSVPSISLSDWQAF
jgi:hypothetical protein